MLITVEECSKELDRIDSKLERLNLERKHVLEVRTLLTRQPPACRLPLSPRLLDILEANPGIDGKGIMIKLDGAYGTRQLTDALSHLRLTNKIENRGSRGQGARWYIKESVNA